MDESKSTAGKAYQSVPTYVVADYGELFRCHAEEIRLLERLRELRSYGCQFVILDIDAMELRAAGRVECYGKPKDKLRRADNADTRQP